MGEGPSAEKTEKKNNKTKEKQERNRNNTVEDIQLTTLMVTDTMCCL